VIDALASGDTTAVQALFQERLASGWFDSMMLADGDGSLILRLDFSRGRAGQAPDVFITSGAGSLAALPVVSHALEVPTSARPFRMFVGIEEYPAEPTLYASLPVAVPPASESRQPGPGVIVVGKTLRTLVEQLGSNASTDVAVYTAPGMPAAATLSGWDRPEIANRLALSTLSFQVWQAAPAGSVVAEDTLQRIRVNGYEMIGMFVPLIINGQSLGVMALLARTVPVLPLRFLTSDTLLFALFLVAILIEVIGALAISTRIIRPLFNSLEEENARISAILGSISDGVILRDPNENIMLANRAATEMLTTPHGFSAHPLDQVRSSANGGPHVHHIEMDDRTIAVSVAAVNTPEGAHIGDALVLRDVTREAIAERTKDSFLDQIGHELRTPLTAVKGYVDVLRLGGDGLRPEVRDRVITGMLEQVQTLSRMIDEIIVLTDFHSSGRLSLNPRLADLNEFVRDVLDAWTGELFVARIAASFTTNARQVPVSIDPRRMRRVLDALLHNVCRFSPGGGVLHITIEAGSSHAVLRLADSGVGISAEDLPRVFDLFYRGEPLDRQGQPLDVRGIGQGLYIVKTIVEAHDGTVEAQSKVGEGAVFTIRLPLASNPAHSPSS
jgi:signal transduction histidine kinase